MRILIFFIFLCLWASPLGVFAQTQKEVERKEPRILILLDESSSMLEKWDGNTPRYKAAGKLILTLMDSIYRVNNKVEFGLRVFGHQYNAQERNCYDTRREVMFSKDNWTQMQLRLADIKPLGVTPIAYSLKEAAENDLVEEDKYAYSIVLITDGGESCGGDICDVVKTLLSKRIYFKPYIVSLVDYAPLKLEYACLGEYLQAVNERSIPTTVDSIVKAFRPALVLTTTQYKQYLETKVMPPDELQIHNTTPIATTTNEPQQVPTVTVPNIKTQESTNTVAHKDINEITTQQTNPVTQQPISVPRVVEKEEIPKLKNITATTFMFPVTFITRAIGRIKVPEIMVPKATEPPDPVVTTFRPRGATIKTDITPKEALFTVKTEDAKETSVQIYFTDGKGNFYNTTPQIVLNDPKTGKEVKKFFRTLDAGGNPDPQKLPAGSYNLSVINGKTKAHNIKIEPDKNNKVLITVHNGSLFFYYKGNMDRPVTEFDALVTLRERGGVQLKQNCTKELEYPPGNYHVSVNTLPPMERNLDLDFEAEYGVGIEEPGWIQFTNTNKIGKVSLYTILGDRFLRFYTMDVSGFPESQKLQLLPGLYKVHYLKYSGSNVVLEEKIEDFKVESNQTTQMELTQIHLNK